MKVRSLATTGEPVDSEAEIPRQAGRRTGQGEKDGKDSALQ